MVLIILHRVGPKNWSPASSYKKSESRGPPEDIPKTGVGFKL